MELGEDDRAGLPDGFRRRGQGRRRRARHGRQGDRDAVALLGGAVPEELVPPRPAREGLQGLHRPRRQWQRQRQQRHHRRDPRACARRAAKILGFPTYAAYRLEDSMAKTPEAVRGLLERVWKPARARALADRDALQALIAEEGGNFTLAPVGLALLRREAAPAPRQFRRRRDQALSRARPHDRGRLRLRHPPVRHHLHRAQGCPGLASGRPGLGGQGRRRQAQGAVLRRLLRPVLKALRRLDDLAARPAEARRRDRAADHQCLQLRQGRRRRAVAAVAGRCAHPVPRVRPRPARHAVQRDLSLAVGHVACSPTSSNCPRSSTSTGRSSRRCCGSSQSTTRPASRCRTTC